MSELTDLSAILAQTPLLKLLLALPALLLFYFLPTVVAFMRRHPQRRTLAAVNLVSGWSGLAWLGVLAWAWTGRREQN
jgi:hypothetical protein